MRETGVVIKVTGDLVEIDMQRGSGCGKCSACSAMADGTLRLFAYNSAGQRKGMLSR